MYQYLIGNITEKTLDSVVIEVNHIGYHVLVAHPDEFFLDQEMKVFTYYHVKDDGVALYGFKNKEDRNIFIKLINVSGIGPKTVNNLMGATSTKELIQAIEFGNTSYLKKLPGIGPKTASQIVLDLKGKLIMSEFEDKVVAVNQNLQDTYEALKSLGYRMNDIDSVLKSIGKEQLTAQEYLRKALQILGNRGNAR